MPNETRVSRLAALQQDAYEKLGIADINSFIKFTVWPFIKAGGDLALVGFHFYEDFIPTGVSHNALERDVFPEEYYWEDNDKHNQNREVCTHGATLLDNEQLRPAECEPLPLPPMVSDIIVPNLQKHLSNLSLPTELDFLYVNRYRHKKSGYIRFHHDQLTKMGPVVVGVSFGATAHLSLARTCSPDTKKPGTEGQIRVEMKAGSM